MTNRAPKQRRRRKTGSNNTIQPQPAPTPPPTDFAALRAEWAQRATNTAMVGVRNEPAEIIVDLCTYILNRASTYRPSTGDLDRYRAQILASWGATRALAPVEHADVWIIPHPGRPAQRFERVACPDCSLKGRSRGCARCSQRGTIIRPIGGTP